MAQKRNAKGQFVKGQSGNPGGRPVDAISKLIREAIAERMTDQKIGEIAQTLIDQAASGDRYARVHLMNLYGIDLDKITLQHSGGVEITVKYVRQGESKPHG